MSEDGVGVACSTRSWQFQVHPKNKGRVAESRLEPESPYNNSVGLRLFCRPSTCRSSLGVRHL